MSDEHSALLGLPYIQAAQAQKHVTHNEALRALDVMVQAAVTDRDRATPPGSPAEGNRHIVAAGASGDWAGHETEIALFQDGVWLFHAPRPGWRVHVLDEALTVTFDGTGWGGADQVAQLGINTAADATNRLAVASDATLLSHDGAGHQIKVNKAAATDTASLLFQTAWSGRAEMGTTGSDGFAIKVSDDGSTWNTALEFDPATGISSGQAVQQSPTDTTPGRLARADHAYGPGNLLGPVSEAAGTPAGAVIERGSNANGDYVRFADGTQICTRAAELDDTTVGVQTYPFPAQFIANGGIAASMNYIDWNSNPYVALSNIRSFVTYADIHQIWGIRLSNAAPTLSAAVELRTVMLVAVGRWF